MWKQALAIPACLALTAVAFIGVTKLESRAARAEVSVATVPPSAAASPVPVPKTAAPVVNPDLVFDSDQAAPVEKSRPKKSGRKLGRVKALSGY